MTEESALHTDLRRQIRRKLETWVMDSLALYKMADADPIEAFGDIMIELITTTVVGMSTLSGTSEKEAGEAISTVIKLRFTKGSRK